MLRNIEEIEALRKQIRHAAQHARIALGSLISDPMEALYTLKFDKFGRDPLKNSADNLIEQLNQTFTIMATLAAARHLYCRFSGLKELKLNPGNRRGWDIESIDSNEINAEVFTAVKPNNNGKLRRDVDNLKNTSKAKCRFVFFYCPNQASGRRVDLEKQYSSGMVQIWALEKHEVI